MLEHRDELALLETLDMGKPISDSLAVDMPSTARCIAWYAEAVDKIYDEVAPTGHDALALDHARADRRGGGDRAVEFSADHGGVEDRPGARGRQFVRAEAVREVAADAPSASRSSPREAGIPDGVFNVVPGFGHTAGKALALHMDVDCIGFTGSTRTGKLMLQYSGQSNMKRVWLECGGKSPNIILADCPDLDRAAAAAASAIFFNQGEMCSAGSRLIVEETVRDAVLEKVVAAARALAPGDPLDPATRLGAIVDAVQLDTRAGLHRRGPRRGRDGCVTGGKRARAGDAAAATSSRRCSPTCSPAMSIAREEIFGPVLATITVRRRGGGGAGRQRRDLRPRGRGLDARHQRARTAWRARCAPAWST